MVRNTICNYAMLRKIRLSFKLNTMCTIFIQMLLKVKLHKPCGFVVKVTITKEMLFSGIVVLVDWRVCVEFVVASVVDFVTSIEVICVG